MCDVRGCLRCTEVGGGVGVRREKSKGETVIEMRGLKTKRRLHAGSNKARTNTELLGQSIIR